MGDGHKAHKCAAEEERPEDDVTKLFVAIVDYTSDGCWRLKIRRRPGS